jgi:uncharacterized protein YpmB
MVSTRTKKIIIWTIVILFLISSGLTFVLYLMAPTVSQSDNEAISPLEEYVDLEENVEVVNSTNEEINVDVPQDNDLQVVVSENEEVNEMDRPVNVALPDGRIDTPTVGDFSDSLQLSQ